MTKKKKINKENIFQYIYIFLGGIYLIVIPIIVIIMCKIDNTMYANITNVRTRFTLAFSFITFCIFLIDILINRKKIGLIKKRKTIYIFIGFLIWCLISTSFSSNLKNSIYGISYRYNGLIEYISYISFAIIGFSLNEKNRNKFFRIFTVVALFICLINIYNVKYNAGLLPLQNYSGIFYNINHYGYFITYSVIIIMFQFFQDDNKILKTIDFIIYVLFIYLLIVNDTFGTYISVLFTLLLISVYAVKKNVKLLYLFLIIPFVVLSVTVNDHGRYYIVDDFDELFEDLNFIKIGAKSEHPLDSPKNTITYVGNLRGELWVHAFKYSLEKPLVGYGLDNLKYKYQEDNIITDTPHNLILNLAATVGYPGMLLYISGLIVLIIKGLKQIKENNHITNLSCFILIDHFISSMFGVTMYYVIPYFMIILGIAISLYDVDKKTKKKKRASA